MKRVALVLVALFAVPLLMAAALALHSAPPVKPNDAAAVSADCCLDPTCPPGCSTEFHAAVAEPVRYSDPDA